MVVFSFLGVGLISKTMQEKNELKLKVGWVKSNF